jgi:hypothetical protein
MNKLHSVQEKMFDLFIFISYTLILISALGLFQSAPKYLAILDYYVRIYLCLFLIWRFNPLRKSTTFTELDRKIAFSAGLVIITTTALNKYLINFQEKIQNNLNIF